jgi:hypothetical protein
MPKKMRRLAIRSLLSSHQSEGTLSILLDLDLEDGKTRGMAELLSALGIEGSVLLVTREPEGNVIRSARNLPSVKTLPANNINTGDLLKYEHLIMTVNAVRRAEGLWGSTVSRHRTPGEERPERVDPPADLEMLRAPTPRRVTAKAAEPVEEPEPEAASASTGPTRSRRARAEATRSQPAPAVEETEAPAPKSRSQAKAGVTPAAAKQAAEKPTSGTKASPKAGAKPKAAAKPKPSAKTTTKKPVAKKPPTKRPRSTS